MAAARTFDIFEDHIMMRTGTIILGGNTSQEIMQAVQPGKTYRISVQQPNNYPKLLGASVATVVVEGCKSLPDGTFSTDYATHSLMAIVLLISQ